MSSSESTPTKERILKTTLYGESSIGDEKSSFQQSWRTRIGKDGTLVDFDRKGTAWIAATDSFVIESCGAFELSGDGDMWKNIESSGAQDVLYLGALLTDAYWEDQEPSE